MPEKKNVIFYAIIPALIAGLFGLVPKIYDKITEPKAILEYAITKGPALKVDSIYKSILSIEVKNSGKKPLTKVITTISPNSSLDAISVHDISGANPEIDKGQPIKVSIQKLHSTERFNVTLMLSSQTQNVNPTVMLRSNEVLGTLKTSSVDKSQSFPLLSSLLSGLSVFIMALVVLNKVKGNHGFKDLFNKPDNLFYIAAKLNFKEITNSFSLSENDVTYLRFSDMLLAKSHDNKDEKIKAIKGLKATLLINHIANDSVESIARNLQLLDPLFSVEKANELRKKSKSINGMANLRNEIDMIIDANEII